jgi:uncharacterized protein (DUF427 family)
MICPHPRRTGGWKLTPSTLEIGMGNPWLASLCRAESVTVLRGSWRIARARLLEKATQTMAKAIWNGKVIAESDQVETVEGNLYFPDASVNREYLRPSSTTSTCPWKGQARYYTLVVDGQENQDAAWYYPDPKPAAKHVKNHMAFWRGVEIEK